MIYLDASVLVSLYSGDCNTARAVQLVAMATSPKVVSTLARLEAVNALSLRVFRKEASRAVARGGRKNLEQDLADGVFQLRSISESAFARANQLSEQFTPELGVGAADILHVATALEFGAHTFFTFDNRQRGLAEAAGLVLNPPV